MILFGTFPTAPVVVVIASAGLVLAAIYSLILMQRVHFGPVYEEGALAGPDWREYFMMLTLLALVLLVGLYPQPLLDTTAGLSTSIAELFAGGDMAVSSGEVR